MVKIKSNLFFWYKKSNQILKSNLVCDVIWIWIGKKNLENEEISGTTKNKERDKMTGEGRVEKWVYHYHYHYHKYVNVITCRGPHHTFPCALWPPQPSTSPPFTLLPSKRQSLIASHPLIFYSYLLLKLITLLAPGYCDYSIFIFRF